MRSLKEQVEDLDISRPEDIDPEDDPFARRDNASDSDEAPSEAGITGCEHYEDVSKSKLRKVEHPVLGTQYTGAAVSRRTLFDDEGNAQAEDSTDDDDDDDKEEEDEEEEPTAKADLISVASRNRSGDSRSDASEESAFKDDTELDCKISPADVRAEMLANGEDDDSEIDSDEAFGSGDKERFKSKGFTFPQSTKSFAAEDSAEDRDSDDDGALVWDTKDEAEVDGDLNMEIDYAASDLDAESQDVSEVDSTSNSDSSAFAEPLNKPTTDRAELKALLAGDAAAIASTLSASANVDARKGRAVKQQYQTFDRLLDARIKLQKGLIAANDVSLPPSDASDVSIAAQSAGIAALKLFGTIELILHSIHEAPTDTDSKKRKRPSPPTTSMTASALWTRISNLEDQCLPRRRAILNKWSSKTRNANGISAPRSRLDNGAHLDTISDILDTQIISENQKGEQKESYDDTLFYQSLLRDLISSRAALSQSHPTVSDIPLPTTAPKQHRRGVDTKASKGRKVRYTIHEKLQNFAAEEDRGTWTESAKAEFFASLFGGQGKMLDEQENANGGMEVDEEEGLREEGALRLFRS